MKRRLQKLKLQNHPIWNPILKRRLQKLKLQNVSMEHELSYHEGDLQQALWRPHGAQRKVQRLQNAGHRRSQNSEGNQKAERNPSSVKVGA